VEPTHASFFSGVGGLDLGLERAGWRTVSFSEIDPYASAVLAQRWPGVPNLGDIVRVAAREQGRSLDGGRESAGRGTSPRDPWHHATLWSGGFPCQDLSVAGKRRGMGAGTRSGLAFAFLDLAAVHRPRFILLENVPGLLSSHGGRDMAALLGALVELGYGVGYRILDSRHFGVPQRRRRVFILGVTPGGRAGAEFAAEVLSVGSRCRRHPPAGVEAGPGAAGCAEPGAYLPQSVNAKWAKGYSGPAGDEHHNLTLGASPDPGGVRAADGLARRLDDRGGVVNALDQRRGGADDNEAQAGHLVAFDPTTSLDQAPSLDSFPPLKQGSGAGIGWSPGVSGVGGPGGMTDDPFLPPGLDSHRYRCCGNGVVADVAEWIGRQLLAAIEAAA